MPENIKTFMKDLENEHKKHMCEICGGSGHVNTPTANDPMGFKHCTNCNGRGVV